MKGENEVKDIIEKLKIKINRLTHEIFMTEAQLQTLNWVFAKNHNPAELPRENKSKRSYRIGSKRIIDFIKTKKHSLEDIQEKFNFKSKEATKYWISKAGVGISDLPSKLKAPVSPKKDLDDSEDWEDKEEFSDIR